MGASSTEDSTEIENAQVRPPLRERNCNGPSQESPCITSYIPCYERTLINFLYFFFITDSLAKKDVLPPRKKV